MTLKPLFNEERTMTRAYQAKLESRYKRDGTAIQSFIYQSSEHGEVNFSATGSATVTRVFAFKEKQYKVIHATAHATSINTTAHITDVTASQIEITLKSTAAMISSVITTSQVRVFYSVTGSNP